MNALVLNGLGSDKEIEGSIVLSWKLKGAFLITLCPSVGSFTCLSSSPEPARQFQSIFVHPWMNGIEIDKMKDQVTAGVARYESLPAQRQWTPSIGRNFAALHRQWWRLHISEKLLIGT
jgi:hypothetical protein